MKLRKIIRHNVRLMAIAKATISFFLYLILADKMLLIKTLMHARELFVHSLGSQVEVHAEKQMTFFSSPLFSLIFC